MGQAFDRDGNLLGEAEGDTRRKVLKQLEKRHPDADEIRIKEKVRFVMEAAEREQLAIESLEAKRNSLEEAIEALKEQDRLKRTGGLAADEFMIGAPVKRKLRKQAESKEPTL